MVHIILYPVTFVHVIETKKYNTETCVGATDKCMNGTYCSSGTCACPTGSTHNANLKNCLTNGKKLLGEVCGSATECYGITGESPPRTKHRLNFSMNSEHSPSLPTHQFT